MGNCLVTKLKESVDNNNLMKLNECLVYIESTGSGAIKMNGTATGQLRSKKDGTIIPLSSSNTLVFNTLSEPGYYFFSDKNLSMPVVADINGTTDGLTLNISDFKGIPENTLKMIDFRDNHTYGKIADLQHSDVLYHLEMETTLIEGTLSEILSRFPNVGKNSSFFNTNSCGNITGTTADLAVMKYSPNRFWLAPRITGDLYAAIEGNGTTTGWRRTWLDGATTRRQMKCSGENVRLWSYNIPVDTAFEISWTANSSSITINGTTTTFDNSGNIIS